VVLSRVNARDVEILTGFLRAADLTLSGLDSPTVRLWVERGADGEVFGSTGYELSADRRHALIRSVAVSPRRRSAGKGSELALFALDRAADEGASTARLFSRRLGPFWQRLGFAPVDKYELAAVLGQAQQVRLFRQTGQLDREVAWSRPVTGCR
jgi:N-acetylglutamate synthase-like GNAT family acetyltransferase